MIKLVGTYIGPSHKFVLSDHYPEPTRTLCVALKHILFMSTIINVPLCYKRDEFYSCLLFSICF